MSGTTKITGNITSLETNVIVNDHVKATAFIDADKLEHLYKAGTNLNLAIAGALVAREEVVFVASTNAVIRGFHAMLNDTGTSTNVDFILKKNGSSILTGTINITHSVSDRTVLDGVLSSTTLAAGDVLSIEMTVTSSTGASGPFAWVEVDEAAS